MEQSLEEQFEALIEKYTELLTGDTNEELKAKVQMWVLYNHIAKSMPALAKHWNQQYPDSKQQMHEIIKDIKIRNETYRQQVKQIKDSTSH
ncbi:DUF2573 family protein [Bacillus solimangrovi]|uniref:DUF2573 domain-containing protein n=1 Tax=Bacillus solimangrovi TaxID=1305675 RepID=A0A1E5LDV1_9BACI|nr:DUF2573 family protein [Bacillus solimangrovi]OEH92267.1 hypothetical protein BFG57_03105 [Bacillus solimangrovi]